MIAHPAASLVRLLARERDAARVLPRLHEAVCEATGASASVVLRRSSLGGGWTPTSAHGLEHLALTPWLADEFGADATGRALVTAAPVVVHDLMGTSPELGARLGGAERAVIVPLPGAQPAALLVLAAGPHAAPDLEVAAAAGDAFVLAMARADTADQLAPAAEVRMLIQDLAKDGSSPAALPSALDAFCRGMARLSAADRVRIWLHDRRARELIQAAGSDPNVADRGVSIPTADSRSPVAASLRRDGAVLVAAAVPDGGIGAVVGLKGRRRALGVMTLEGVRVEPGADVAMLHRCEEIGRQLSAVLENVQLLDDVVRSRAERAHLERRLAQSQKLLALGQFVAGVAHELNNPLQGVLGHLELIRRTRLPRSLARDLSLVYREADRAARIVRNLLVFAGSGKLTRRRVSLNRIASHVLTLRAARLRAAGIEVVSALDDTLPPVSGDRLLLEQALVNLVVNAEQAMADGGRLVVRTEPAADGARVIVADSGRGMDEHVRARLFEPFFTTREAAGGTGLGLAIVYGIVQAHGGTIDVESSPGMGASFRITLTPAARPGARG